MSGKATLLFKLGSVELGSLFAEEWRLLFCVFTCCYYFIAVLNMSLKAPLSSTALQERPPNKLCLNWLNSVWPVVHTMLVWGSNKGETPITSSWGMKFRYVGNSVHLFLFVIAEFLVEERIW